MNSILEIIKNAPLIEAKLGYTFCNPMLLALAFVHRSFINENRDIIEHNERLEFLGDSILGFLMAEHLYRNLPKMPEGDLSYLRSRLVEASSCITYVHKMDVEKFILLGKGEKVNPGRGRDSIKADLFEAIVGAIYLDGGLEAARQFLFGNFLEEINAIVKTPLQNWKANLQDFCQKKFQVAPQYTVISETGPDHSKVLRIQVSINGDILGEGEGSSKKEAQQAAAENALSKLDTQ